MRQRSAPALTLARELAHPASLAYALIHAAWFHQLRREPHVVHSLAETVIGLSTEQGYPEWLGQGSILRGWALAEFGQGEASVAQMREGLAATGGELLQPLCLALLAAGQGRSGQMEAGLHTIAEALALVETYGERLWEPSCTGSRGNSCYGARRPSTMPPKPACNRPSTWHAASRRKRWHCAPP